MRYHSIGGELVAFTAEEEAAMDAIIAEEVVRANEERFPNLYAEAYRRQNLGVDSNYMALLNATAAAAKASAQPTPPKAAVVIAWVDAIWSIYYTLKANGGTVADFGPEPTIVPHTYLEVRAEAVQ